MNFKVSKVSDESDVEENGILVFLNRLVYYVFFGLLLSIVLYFLYNYLKSTDIDNRINVEMEKSVNKVNVCYMGFKDSKGKCISNEIKYKYVIKGDIENISFQDIKAVRINLQLKNGFNEFIEEKILEKEELLIAGDKLEYLIEISKETYETVNISYTTFDISKVVTTDGIVY